ncbi:two-pore potassium channel 3 [Quillaja saponaria]|uniref:Two-pore potassium channel 3 n=1 Tax=Quillaja saponaria TaxID=32244 RepID=A0AAD7VI06_QUISA|nr:two-pore potassium channel 3 [Quillaja saponaria]
MDKKPLLPHGSLEKKPMPPPLCSLPEHDEIVLPITPSSLEDRLIFGPCSDCSLIVDALTLSFNTPRISASSSQDPAAHKIFNPHKLGLTEVTHGVKPTSIAPKQLLLWP